MSHDPSHHELTPDCGRFQSELPNLLYGELSPEARGTLEAHLETCPACRDEWTAVRETGRLLSRWETPPATDDPRLLAREIAARARQPYASVSAPRARTPGRARLVRWSARLLGAAAAVLFVLGLTGARASVGGGRMELSFALPGMAAADPLPSADWHEEMRGIARDVAANEFEQRAAGLASSQEELFQRCSQLTQQELVRLSQAVDYALAQNQERFDTRLATFGREVARADLETRRVVTDLAAATLPVSLPGR